MIACVSLQFASVINISDTGCMLAGLSSHLHAWPAVVDINIEDDL